MPSDSRFLSVVRSAVAELSSVCGLSDTDARGIALALDEALANIICHAYKRRGDQAIQLKCETSPEYLEFTLFDQGEPADLAKICSVPLNSDSLSGRGTHIIRMIMDEVSYERVPEGNRLRLKKKFAGREHGCQEGVVCSTQGLNRNGKRHENFDA
jgi:anti-sigma regulatory factor (Ser/Thr protein kinase)